MAEPGVARRNGSAMLLYFRLTHTSQLIRQGLVKFWSLALPSSQPHSSSGRFGRGRFSPAPEPHPESTP